MSGVAAAAVPVLLAAAVGNFAVPTSPASRYAVLHFLFGLACVGEIFVLIGFRW